MLNGLPNLGMRSEAMLAEAGIHNLADLKQIGAVRAFLTVKRAGCRPSLNLLWALEGALSGRPWQEVAKTERLNLLLQVAALEKSDH